MNSCVIRPCAMWQIDETEKETKHKDQDRNVDLRNRFSSFYPFICFCFVLSSALSNLVIYRCVWIFRFIWRKIGVKMNENSSLPWRANRVWVRSWSLSGWAQWTVNPMHDTNHLQKWTRNTLTKDLRRNKILNPGNAYAHIHEKMSLNLSCDKRRKTETKKIEKTTLSIGNQTQKRQTRYWAANMVNLKINTIFGLTFFSSPF